jgi:hypothetical protein
MFFQTGNQKISMGNQRPGPLQLSGYTKVSPGAGPRLNSKYEIEIQKIKKSN